MRRREVFVFQAERLGVFPSVSWSPRRGKAPFCFAVFLPSPKKSGNSGKSGNFSLPTEFLPDSGQSGVVFYRVFRQKMPLSLGLKVFICLFTGGWQEFCRLMFPDSDRGKIGERLFYVPERGTGGPRKNLGGGWGWNNPKRKIEKPFYSTKSIPKRLQKHGKSGIICLPHNEK